MIFATKEHYETRLQFSRIKLTNRLLVSCHTTYSL